MLLLHKRYAELADAGRRCAALWVGQADLADDVIGVVESSSFVVLKCSERCCALIELPTAPRRNNRRGKAAIEDHRVGIAVLARDDFDAVDRGGSFLKVGPPKMLSASGVFFQGRRAPGSR